MEEQARKRLRINDNPNEDMPMVTSGSRNATAIKINSTNMIPCLVSEIFLENLRVVQLLKISRLVCKSWNITATKSLRNCSVVHLKEGAPNVNFAFVLLGRCFGPLAQLPCPIKSFHVEGSTFTDPIFMKLALLPSFEVTRLELKLDGANQNFDQLNLALMLASQKTSITDLTIVVGSGHLNIDEALWANDVKMLSLKSLKLQDGCMTCIHIPFLKKILGMCNPEKLDLDGCDEELLISLLSQDKVTNLKKFVLYLEEMSTKSLRHLVQLNFFCLKILEVYSFFVNNSDDIQQWKLFCKNVSPFVEDFFTYFQLSNKSDLVFPNLKQIYLNEFTELSGFTPDWFPSLLKIFYLFHCTLLRTPENNAVPHEGVQSLDIEITNETMKTDYFDKELLLSLVYLGKQFPNVCLLVFTIERFLDFTIADIYEAFPKLTAIELDGNCDFFAFSGIRDSVVTQYLELGRPVEKIPRRKSITDFRELQTIAFGSEFVVQPDMIIHCLPRIPKLRRVSLHWNESLSAPLLRDSLGHLEKIMILNSSKLEQGFMFEVSKMLPNIYMK